MGWEAEHMSMLQIGILGVAGVLLALQFKSGKSEYGIYISIVLGLLIFATLLGKISLIKDVLNEINGVAGPGNEAVAGVMNIILKEDAQALDEVVVVGYGVQKKSSVTGAISSVKAEDFEKSYHNQC